VLAAVIGAAACTLRQSYLPAVALFLALALVFRSQRLGWRVERRTWLITVAVAGACLLPWCVAAFISNRTFLFPFMKGTWNHGLSLAPSGWSWVDKLAFLMNCVIDAQPFVVLPIVFPLLAFTRDTRTGRPLAAFFLASTAGFLVLVSSFTGSDSYSLSRYAFGYFLPLLLIFVLETVNEVEEGPVQLPQLGRWVLLAALLIQIAFPRAGVVKRYKNVLVELAEVSSFERQGDPNTAIEAARYAAMQATIPSGASVAVLLDDPAYLDFARNTIFNLDTPGYASPAPQLPMFVGAEAVRAYFLSQGVRYLAFVRGNYSRYMFRREFWLWRIYHDVELFQVMSAYIVNALDNFTELAASSMILHDVDGLVVVNLERPHSGVITRQVPALDPRLESTRREAWMGELAVREGLEREWALTSRRNFIFADGISGVAFDDGKDPRWYEVYERDDEPTRGVPARWLHRRGHIRLRGDSRMHLVLRGKVNLNAIYTHPRLDVAIGGRLLASVVVGDDGAYTVDVTISAADIADWADLYLVFNTIGTPEREVRDLHVARLDHVIWETR
jgi:hypothetical protein